jgi:hypothetical protein
MPALFNSASTCPYRSNRCLNYAPASVRIGNVRGEEACGASLISDLPGDPLAFGYSVSGSYNRKPVGCRASRNPLTNTAGRTSYQRSSGIIGPRVYGLMWPQI